MGGSSSGSTTSNTYKATTHNTPWADIYTDNNGTNVNLKDGALNTSKNFIDKNIGEIQNQILNPTLDSTTNQAKIAAYNKEMNKNVNQQFENNIISPLSQRNMIRSSQATNLYNGLQNTMADKYDDFITNLLATSSKDNQDLYKMLMDSYLSGKNAINDETAQAINQAAGKAITSSSVSAG